MRKVWEDCINMIRGYFAKDLFVIYSTVIRQLLYIRMSALFCVQLNCLGRFLKNYQLSLLTR